MLITFAVLINLLNAFYKSFSLKSLVLFCLYNRSYLLFNFYVFLNILKLSKFKILKFFLYLPFSVWIITFCQYSRVWVENSTSVKLFFIHTVDYISLGILVKRKFQYIFVERWQNKNLPNLLEKILIYLDFYISW